MATVAARPTLSGERRFYLGIAAAIFVLIILGFGPTYYFRPVTGQLPPLPATPLVHLHGLVFSLWLLLFVVQTSLVSGRRLDIHRRMGPVAAALAMAMVVIGTLSALYGVHRASGPPGIPPLSWLAVPLIAVPAFGGLIFAALHNRKNPAAHKRLMVMAMVAMLAAATGRLFAGPIGMIGVPALFVAVMIARDLLTLRRVHKATAWGGAVAIGSLVLPMLIWSSAVWLAFARWASSLVA